MLIYNLEREGFEIMAPVGSEESLMAALEGPTPFISVSEGLNMRSRSSNNFTTEDLRKIVAICGEHGIKSYLTVNTVIYDEDLPLMREIIDAAKDAGVPPLSPPDASRWSYATASARGALIHAIEYLERGGVEVLRPLRRCGRIGSRIGTAGARVIRDQ